jgi:hypothetical protein
MKFQMNERSIVISNVKDFLKATATFHEVEDFIHSNPDIIRIENNDYYLFLSNANIEDIKQSNIFYVSFVLELETMLMMQQELTSFAV